MQRGAAEVVHARPPERAPRPAQVADATVLFGTNGTARYSALEVRPACPSPPPTRRTLRSMRAGGAAREENPV